MINSEDDVRAYVRIATGNRARWVEPALGSTPGLPDCWVPFSKVDKKGANKNQVHLELKVGAVKQGHLSFTVRPEQRREIKAMIADGIPVGFLVGVEETNSAAFLVPTRESLFGKVPLAGSETPRLWADTIEPDCASFWRGVNFIFCDSVKMGQRLGGRNEAEKG